MIRDLIKYLVEIKSLIQKNGDNQDFLIQEVTKIAVENWVRCSIPNLSEKQFYKLIVMSLARKRFNLN